MENNEREWGIIAEKHAIRPIHDRVLILIDPIKTHYDCKDCLGKGHTDEICPNCNGTKLEPRHSKDSEPEACRDCTFSGEVTRTYGYRICPVCKGRKGIIAIPENALKRPLTGKIISIGQKVEYFKVGNHVIFTTFTGTEFEIEGIPLRIAVEKDIIGEYKALTKDATQDKIQEEKYEELSDLGVE